MTDQIVSNLQQSFADDSSVQVMLTTMLPVLFTTA